MRIALIGYGKMGREIERLAAFYNIEIGLILERSSSDSDWEKLSLCDVAIEFTEPASAYQNIERTLSLHVPIVVGTTGWSQDIKKVERLVESYQGALLFGENYSIGVQMLTHLSKIAASFVKRFAQYTVSIEEVHHTKKKDAPSGTALALQSAIGMPVGISSKREGEIIGTHIVTIESDHELLTLTHQAKKRELFALGAIDGAKWLMNRRGMYHFSAILEEAACIKNH